MSLRERKQQRTRAAIVRAAYELFAERGYDAVTVAEIADRAEVGRTTFFRYFPDKQEVLFDDEDKATAALTDAIRAAAEPHAPIGDSLPQALSVLEHLVATFADAAKRDPERMAVQARLLANRPELAGRHLLKQQRQATAIAGVLVECGATHPVANLAPQLALACLHAAQRQGGDDPAALAEALADAFSRLAGTST